ncbi:MAG: hypothetical protein JWR40_1103 [Massilia sp.]|jgi:hypothetical protein|nr:hypothetical protein [Massilia sp.]
MFGMILPFLREVADVDINLDTVVNQHFLDRVIRLAGARRVTATRDIADVPGLVSYSTFSLDSPGSGSG